MCLLLAPCPGLGLAAGVTSAAPGGLQSECARLPHLPAGKSFTFLEAAPPPLRSLAVLSQMLGRWTVSSGHASPPRRAPLGPTASSAAPFRPPRVMRGVFAPALGRSGGRAQLGAHVNSSLWGNDTPSRHRAASRGGARLGRAVPAVSLFLSARLPVAVEPAAQPPASPAEPEPEPEPGRRVCPNLYLGARAAVHSPSDSLV